MTYLLFVMGIFLIVGGVFLTVILASYKEKAKYLWFGLLIPLGVASIILCNKLEVSNILSNPDNVTQYATINNIKGTSIELDSVSYELNKEILTKYNVNTSEFKIGDIVKFTYSPKVTGTGYLTGIEKIDKGESK